MAIHQRKMAALERKAARDKLKPVPVKVNSIIELNLGPNLGKNSNDRRSGKTRGLHTGST